MNHAFALMPKDKDLIVATIGDCNKIKRKKNITDNFIESKINN